MKVDTPSGFAQKPSVWRYFLCKSGFCTKSLCAVVLCLIQLVSVVVGRTIPKHAGVWNRVIAELGVMGSAKNIVINNYPVHIPLLFITHFLDGGRGWCWSWRR